MLQTQFKSYYLWGQVDQFHGCCHLKNELNAPPPADKV